MQPCHTPRATSAVFDDPNLVSSAGLVPVVAMARAAGLTRLAAEHLSVPTDKGANAGLKVTSLVAGMVAGADSIDDMAILRHGAMNKVFANAYAPSTLGSFLRAFTFGHVRQLDAVASRFLTNLSRQAALTTPGQRVMVDLDDTIIEVHGYTKQGSGYGYTRVRGLNALIATATTPGTAPVVVAQRLRKGSCGSPRGAATLVRDALRTTKKITGTGTPRMVLRADSAYFGYPTLSGAIKAGAEVSITTAQTKTIKAAITQIPTDAWTPIEYTDAIYDEETKTWISRAEVAEIPFTAFAAQKKANHITGRLVVRRIPDLNPTNITSSSDQTVQDVLFQTWRFHAFFTTTPTPSPAHPDGLDTVAADKTHRAHAIIEQVHADLKNSALAHLPSASFAANSAWLVLAVVAFNLTRAAAVIAGPLARATTATIRRKLIAVPARIATSARRITLHLPNAWPWASAWVTLFDRVSDPPPALPA
jgi:Transposase DDE domain group 1